MDVLFGILELIAWVFWGVAEFLAASRFMRWFLGTVVFIVVVFVLVAALK